MAGAVGAIIGIVIFIIICFGVVMCCRLVIEGHSNVQKLLKKEALAEESLKQDSRFIPLAMVKFLDDMEREKPVRFTSQQLRIATDNFTIQLGAGAFGKVYKGIVSNNTPVAVKLLNETSDKSIEQQFMAEMSTLGRTHHFNLVRLYGFCFESNLRALVYEFMVNGSLDKYLFKSNNDDDPIKGGFEKLHEIALGTARGITYLHEDCQQRIVHYDIKPGNVLLDKNFHAKVADFGLAKLCNRDDSHITMTGFRGTLGYSAPELSTPLPVTHKCDVYSFGMLLFEIIRRRRNTDFAHDDVHLQWFPLWAWDRFQKKQLKDIMIVCGFGEKLIDEQVVERLVKLALCCVQSKPENRPVMSNVVKMLEGDLEVPEPLNNFAHLISGVDEEDGFSARMVLNVDGSDWDSDDVVTNSKSSVVGATPIMSKYEITIASA